jgi:hypothetical protein
MKTNATGNLGFSIYQKCIATTWVLAMDLQWSRWWVYVHEQVYIPWLNVQVLHSSGLGVLQRIPYTTKCCRGCPYIIDLRVKRVSWDSWKNILHVLGVVKLLICLVWAIWKTCLWVHRHTSPQVIWIWHSYFGMHRSYNKINVLQRSQMLSRLAECKSQRFTMRPISARITRGTI